MRAILISTALCGAAALAGPAAALASIVSVDFSTGTALFRAGPGQSDVFSDQRFLPPGGSRSPFTEPSLPFTDSLQPLTAGEGCVQGFPVWCQAENEEVTLGADSDRFDGWTSHKLTVFGGAGDDTIRASGGRTNVSGGPGADRISAGANGLTTANGDAGDDAIQSIGGPESHFDGGTGDDLLVSGGKNTLSGGHGNDDLILGSSGGNVTGGQGADTLLMRGQPGNGFTTLDGGGGPDTIVAGPGSRESVFGGAGDDSIDVSGDERIDTVECGSGNDVVFHDAVDVISADCEARAAGPMPTTGAVDAALAHLADVFPAASF